MGAGGRGPGRELTLLQNRLGLQPGIFLLNHTASDQDFLKKHLIESTVASPKGLVVERAICPQRGLWGPSVEHGRKSSPFCSCWLAFFSSFFPFFDLIFLMHHDN